MYRVILFQWVIFLHCQFVSLLVVFFFCLCRSWECQAGTSRRTGLQHQHNPPQVEPPQSLPVSPPVLVPTVHQLLAAGTHCAAECTVWYLIYTQIQNVMLKGGELEPLMLYFPTGPILSAIWHIFPCLPWCSCVAFAWGNAGPGSSRVLHLSLPPQSSTVSTLAQTWEEMREEGEERDGTSLELDLWCTSPPLTQALKPAQVRDLYQLLRLNFDCIAVFLHY